MMNLIQTIAYIGYAMMALFILYVFGMLALEGQMHKHEYAALHNSDPNRTPLSGTVARGGVDSSGRRSDGGSRYVPGHGGNPFRP